MGMTAQPLRMERKLDARLDGVAVGLCDGRLAASNSVATRRQSSATWRHLVARSGVLAFSALSLQRAASAR